MCLLFVQWEGGGLFIAGGDETFGVKGLAATPIARVLPVNVDPKGSSGDPKILAVGVLDVSASLFYKPETLDRAVNYIVESFAPLSEGSLVRVFGFSDEVHELVPLDTFQGVEALETQIRDALSLLAEEFERRRQLGLQPEGLAMYDARLACGDARALGVARLAQGDGCAPAREALDLHEHVKARLRLGVQPAQPRRVEHAQPRHAERRAERRARRSLAVAGGEREQPRGVV